MNSKEPITEMYPWISLELDPHPLGYARHTLGITAPVVTARAVGLNHKISTFYQLACLLTYSMVQSPS